jgi:hypothetical protein
MADLRDRTEKWFNDSRRVRPTLAVLLLLGGAVFVIVAIRKSLDRELDIYVILDASRKMLSGGDIYSTPAPNGAYYLYTPLLALLFIPFALLPPPVAGVVWTLACISLLAWSLHEAVRLVSGNVYPELRPFEKWLLHLTPVVLCADAISSEVRNAQVNCLILAAAVISLRLIRNEVSAGAVLGLALAAKVFTAPVMLYELLFKRFRLIAAATFAAVIGVIVPAAVVGWQRNVDYLTYWTRNIAFHSDLVSHRSGFAGNVSVQAVLTRLLTDIPAFIWNGETYHLKLANIDPSTVGMIGICVPFIALLLLVLYYVLFREQPLLISYWGGIALAFAVVPLITPVLERPHFVLLLPAYVYVSWFWLHERLRSRSFYVLILATWILSTLTLKLYVGSFWGNVFWSVGAPTLADICLIAAIFVAAVASTRPRFDGRLIS